MMQMLKPQILFWILFLFAELSWGAFSNYNSILIGDKSSGMGGVGAAVVGDASGCAWYNPATCALIRARSFSAAVGIYKKYDTVYGDEGDLVQSGMRVNQGFFRPLPSSTGSIVHFNDFLKTYTFSLSIITPEYNTFKGDLANSNSSKTTMSYTDESLWVGGSISRRVSKNEAMGLTVYYTARSYMKSLTDRTFDDATHTRVYQEEKGLTQNAVVAILGYTYEFNRNWRLGASVRLPSIHVAGSATYFDNTLNSGTVVSTNNYPSLSSNSHIPQKYTLGFAYEEPGSITIAGDISTYSHEGYQDVNTEVQSVAEYIEHRSIVNGHLGFDFYLRKWLIMRIGGFTNFSSHPDPNPELVRGQGDHIDQLGWAANLAMKSGPITYTFGGYYIGGRGKSIQRINQNLASVNMTQQVFTMLVGTAYSY